MSQFENILNLTDPLYEAARTMQYRLSFLVARESFSVMVTHSVSRQVLKLETYKLVHADIPQNELPGWPAHGEEYFGFIQKHDSVAHTWQSVDVAIASHKLTVAPEVFLANGKAADLMSVAHESDGGEEIITETIFDLGPAIALAIPKYISEYFAAIFPSCTFHCAPAIFVKGLIREHSRLISRQVFLNFYKGYFEIAVIQGLRLLYLNTFRYSASSDVLYFVIFALEQLGFVPSEENITLMGDIADSEIVFSQLKMYCGSLCYAGLPSSVEFSEAFSSQEFHRYFTLFNIPV